MNVDALIMISTMERPKGFKATHRAVLIALSTEADQDFEAVMMLREIADEAWIEPATARSCLDQLVSRGLIDDLGLEGKYSRRYRLCFAADGVAE